MRGIIVCGGTIRNYTHYNRIFDRAQLLLCADGGAAHFKKFGIMPHILLGDFDSITKEDMDSFKNAGVEIMKFPVEKDMTDTELAIELAAEKGCTEIFLLGALGTRLDHSMSNVFMLKKMMDLGIKGVIVDEYNEIRLIDRSIRLKSESGVKVSLLPFTDAVHGVTTKGLYYPLENATLHVGSTWGISNEFVADDAEVEIQGGLLLVLMSRD